MHVNKKVHADSLVTTTHFIKKSVMVPINEDYEPTDRSNADRPFTRGIMTFDDFNYRQFNEHILLEEPQPVDKLKIIKERKYMSTMTVVESVLDSQDHQLTEENMASSPQLDFVHSLITVEPSDIEIQEKKLKDEKEAQAKIEEA